MQRVAPGLNAPALIGRLLVAQVIVGMCALLGAATSTAGEETPTPATPEPGRHLDLTMDRNEHDFGVTGQHAELKTRFTYRNTSDQTLEMIHAAADCGCNFVDVTKSVLAPGESGELTVGFQTGVLSGRITKRVRLWTAKRSRGEIVIPITISVVSGLIVAPGAVSFRDVPLGSKPTAHFDVKWYDGVGKPFELTAIEVPGHDFEISTERYKPKTDDPWRGYRVAVTFKTAPPLGMYSAEVLVRTTDPDHARVTLPLSANVVGKVWVQSRTLHFGIVPQGTSRRATMKFRPLDQSVSFGNVTANSRSGHLQVDVMPDPRHGDKGYWVLTVTVPEDTEPGRLDDEIVELHTGVAGEERIDIQVRGRIRARRQ